MAKPLTATKNTAQMSLNNSNTAQLSVRMSVQFLKEHLDDEFVHLFSHSDETAQHLADSFIENGYDESQPVHLAYIEDEDKEVVIDGMTRLHALELANFFDVPVYKHTFKTRLDALMHAYRLQLDRRNLNDAQKIAAVEKMMLLKNPSGNGKTAAAIAEQLGMSTRNVEKTINIIKNGDEETKNAVLNAQMSINAADKKVHNARKAAQSDDDGISDALEDNSEQPKGLVISDHSDHIERPTNKLSPEEDSERTKERRKSYELGFIDGKKEALEFLNNNGLEQVKIKHFGKLIPVKSSRWDKTARATIIEADEKSQRLKLTGDQAVDLVLNETITAERLIQELSKLPPKAKIEIATSSVTKEAVHFYFYPDYHYAVISDNNWATMDGEFYTPHRFEGEKPTSEEKPDTEGETNASDSDGAFDIEFEDEES